MSINKEPELLDEQDWNILQANDLYLREKRRSVFTEEPSPPLKLVDLKMTPVQNEEPNLSEENIESVEIGEDWSFDETENMESTIDWMELVSDFDEFDEHIIREQYTGEFLADRDLTSNERAKQIAIELVQKYGWNDSEIRPLTELFDTQSYGPTKAAIERLFERGMTEDELMLAIQIRRIWDDRTEFSIDFGHTSWTARVARDMTRSVFVSLSWPAVLRLVRVTTSLSDETEIEYLLDELYTRWYSSQRLRVEFRSFYYYLLYWLDQMEIHTKLDNSWHIDFEERHDISDLYNEENLIPFRNAPINQKLEELGILPMRIHRSLDEQLK